MGTDEVVGRMGGRADGRTGQKGCEQSSGRGRKGRGQSSGRADKAHEARTGGRAEEARMGPNRRERADGRTRQLGVEEARSSGLGGWADWQSSERAKGRRGGGADEGVGLGLKGQIPRGPFYSWAPSPLASSEHECAGCMGVQWGPVGFPVKYSYLVPGLICLV